IRIPGIFVDYLVLSTPDTHWQTYGEVRNNTYTGRSRSDIAVTPLPLCAKKIVARRALYEIARYNAPIVNLGIGTPEFIARVA
ncbi:acyl CoA:acetate/3-ketoacid CoA transferase, partial [Pseudonocardia sp. EV170527-09]